MADDLSSDVIRLSGLRIRANHGVYPEERQNGQDFVIDISVWLDSTTAASQDDINKTVDYGKLAEQVAEVVKGEPLNLIETLAEQIAQVVLGFNLVQKTRVTVHKPNAPMPVQLDDVSITINRYRQSG